MTMSCSPYIVRFHVMEAMDCMFCVACIAAKKMPVYASAQFEALVGT